MMKISHAATQSNIPDSKQPYYDKSVYMQYTYLSIYIYELSYLFAAGIVFRNDGPDILPGFMSEFTLARDPRIPSVLITF